MSADNAYFVYLDRGGWWRVMHGFASHLPELEDAELEDAFKDAWGHTDFNEALNYAQARVNDEYICEYGVWVLNGPEDADELNDDSLVHPDKWWEH